MISVLIPNYNHAAFLKQRIDTVLFQTYQDFEVIILDDCSTDNSKEIIEQYRDHPKVTQIVYNGQNSGTAFRQWQKGIDLAKGEWIWIAESDDWCESNLLETLVQQLKPTSTLAIAQSIVVANTGEILWHSIATHFAKSFAGKDFVKQRMLLDNFGVPNASMCIFKRSAYLKIGTQFTDFTFCGDWLMWVLIALQGEVFVSGKYLNYFRKHDKDVSGNAYRNGLHYSEYFTLLDIFEQKQIINQQDRKELLKGKLKMFLNDRRLDGKVKETIRKRFNLFLKKDYYLTSLKFHLVHGLKKINRTTGNTKTV